ncbi:hypothetical protein BX283_0069 [Streptomyces sp. TLI_146]|nr:hypothetical protein BX283_0069 [Streptomyces sp. TLI_146]
MSSLERVIPGLVEARPGGAREVEFERIRQQLGVVLPSDYRELVSTYATFEIDDFLRVWSPTPGAEDGFCADVRDELEILEDLCGEGEDDLAGGYLPYPAEGGLLPWGQSSSGDTFYWRVSSPDSDLWPVVVGTRDNEWWEFEGGVIAFLVGLIDGSIERRGLPGDVPSGNPRVYVLSE